MSVCASTMKSVLTAAVVALCLTCCVSGMACTDQDKQIWSQKGLAAFTSDMESCGHECALKDKSCASDCVKRDEGYSDGCSSCFGDLFGCTRDHCKFACIGGQTQACKDCVKKAGCPGVFTSCSGFTPPSSDTQASAACTDQDKQIWSQKGLAAFTSDMESCGHECALKDKSCASDCVKRDEGYSDGCSSCFGDLFGCTRDHCKFACIGGQTQACKDCVKKAGCPGVFTSCSGFTPPSSDTQANAACTDQDKQIWSQKGLAAFTSDMESCGHECALKDKSCASDCVKRDEGYSDGCSSCFGDLFGCTRDHCKFACIGGQTQACKDCVKKAGCPGVFTSCSGFTPPSSDTQANAACTDQDKQIWSQKGLAAFTSDMESCGHECALKDKSCASDCVKRDEGYSDGCSSCFGDLFGCTRDHCKFACIGGQTQACKDCVKKAGCPGVFTSCSGFTPPSSREVAPTCTGSADPHAGICYQGSSSILGQQETIHVKVDSYASSKGVMDLTGSGVKAISCINKPFTKTGQDITTDVSDCIHVFGLKLSDIAYCSDQDKVIVTLKIAGFDDRVELDKVTCAEAEASIVV